MVPSAVASDAGLAAAVAAFAPRVRPLRLGGAEWPAARAPAEDTAETAGYPALPYRLLAAFRIWAVGQYFFPYRELMGERWDRVLTETIPRLEAARDSVEYGLALAEMAAHLHDSHVRVTSPPLEAALGTAVAPVYVRMIEGQPVITHFMNDTLARRGGAQVGDVILSVDGEDAHARMRRLARYISASTRSPSGASPPSDHAGRRRHHRPAPGPPGRGRGPRPRARVVTDFELTGRTGPFSAFFPATSAT